MKNAKYEKPSIKLVDLRNEQQIAAEGPCMPMASHGDRTFYFDWPGDGWVQLITESTNCNGRLESAIYIDNPAIEGEADKAVQQEAINAAKAALDYDKQAFAGAVYGEPDPSWS